MGTVKGWDLLSRSSKRGKRKKSDDHAWKRFLFLPLFMNDRVNLMLDKCLVLTVRLFAFAS